MPAETGQWMPMYWSDYFGDTTSLTIEEHGAYLLLIGTYWRRARPLPDDDSFLSSTVKLSRKRWRIIRPKILEYFSLVDGSWVHERIEKEILRSSERLNSARANGRAGGLAKSKLLTITTTKEESKKESSLRSDSTNPKPAKVSKTQIPEDCPTKEDQQKGTAFWLARDRQDLVDRLDDQIQAFRAHHRKEGNRMADWSAAWTTWYGNAIRFNKPPNGSLFHQSQPSWKPLKVVT